MKSQQTTRRLVTSAMLIAVASVLALVSEFIPFLQLRFGGTLTLASMLPIILISYMYGPEMGPRQRRSLRRHPDFHGL